MNKQPITSWEDALRAGEQSRQNAGTGTELSLMLGIGVLALYPIFFGIDYVAVRFPIAGVIVYALLMIPAFFAISIGLWVPDREGDADDAVSTLILSTLGCILATVSYSQFCRHLNYFVPGFSVARSSFWSWLAFGIDECLNAVLFDAPEIYGWNLSAIKPTALWAKSLRFLYHFSLLLIMTVAIIQNVQRTRNSWRHPRLREESVFGRVWIVFLKYTGPAVFIICAITGPVLMSFHERVPDMSLVRVGISLGLAISGVSAIIGGVLVWIRSRSLTLLIGMLLGDNTRSWKEWYLWRYLIWQAALLVGAVWIGQTLIAYGMDLVPLAAP